MDRGGPEREAASRRNTGRAWNSIRDKRVTGGQDDVFSKKLAPAAETALGWRIFLWKSATRGALAERALSCSAPASDSRESPGGV